MNQEKKEWATPEDVIAQIRQSKSSIFTGPYAQDADRYLKDYKIMKSQFDYIFDKLATVEKLSNDYKRQLENLRSLRAELVSQRESLKELETLLADSILEWKLKTIDPGMMPWDRIEWHGE